MPPDLRSWPARLGVSPGDTVQLMADVTRVALLFRRARVPFRPADLLDAFADAVGPTGTVLVPTYTFDLEDGAVFDVRRTGSISGALALAALEHPRFVRTPHPLHSFAVAGAHAHELATRDEPGSFGPRSPFAFLRERHARLIAVDLLLDDALTYVHHVEEEVGVPYRRHRNITVHHTDASGRTERRTWSIYGKKPGHHMRFTRLDALLLNGGAMATHELDGVVVRVVDLARAHGLIARDITDGQARSIHAFRWSWWVRDMLKGLLRTFGIRRGRTRTSHAAGPR